MIFLHGSVRRLSAAVIAALTIVVSITVSAALPVGAQERPLLRLGSSGDAVAVLEQRLTELGYQLDTIDTDFESDTRTAVITLQQTARIARDGIVGPNTWAALDAGIIAPAPDPTPTPPATGRPTLRLGSSGDAVAVLEQRLTELGYQLDTIDTDFESDTRTAVITLQQTARIARDGIVGPNTWAALDAGIIAPAPDPTPTPPATGRPTLRLGSSGDAVAVLEQRLTELGYQLDTIDTDFESDTRTVVITLQQTARIARDGIVGPNTWAALDAGITAPAPDPTPTPTPAPDPGPAPSDPPTAPATLRIGSTGDQVLALERRLAELGYWLGDVDANFGSNTHHAVVALQKAAEIGRDGVVGPNTRAALDAGIRPSARTSSGKLIEVDLTHQLLLVVDDGAVQEIHNTATGRVAGTTPVGTWTVERQIDDYRYAPLGLLYRPKYFYRGVAIHGYTSVPSSPASHGCVRLTYPAMDHIWSSGAAPLGTTVEVYR